jgi:hypothetical protein
MSKSPYFKYVKRKPTQYLSNSKAWITATFIKVLRTLDANMVAKNQKIMFFIDKHSAHARHTSRLNDIKDVFFF